MDFRQLQSFLAVADTANVTKAARQLFIAQSALSAQLARLETEVGSPLFVRSRHGMRLTESGTALRPFAVQILAMVDRAQAEMDDLRGLVSGRLRLGLVQVPPAALDVIGAIASFHRQYSNVELVVRTGASADLGRAVADGELDLAMVALGKADLPSTLHIRGLCEEPLIAVLSTSAKLRSNQRRISVNTLIEHGPFIHYRVGSGLRHAVVAAFDRAGVEINAPFELDQVGDMVRLAALGVGVTIVPLSALPVDHAGGKPPYRTVHLTDQRARHTLSMVTFGPPSPAAARFLALLEGRAQPIGHRQTRSK